MRLDILPLTLFSTREMIMAVSILVSVAFAIDIALRLLRHRRLMRRLNRML